MIEEYFNTFINSLESFRLTGGSNTEFDEDVIKNIDKMTPLRDDFVDLTKIVFSYSASADLDLDGFKNFFEKLVPFLFKPANVNTSTNIDFDNYKFFAYELMLYFITILLKYRKYNEAAYFINSQYFFKDQNNNLTHCNIDIFNSHITSLTEIRNRRLQLNRIDLVADLIKQRATRQDIFFTELLDTDLILHYITSLQIQNFAWFPKCSVFNEIWGRKIEFFLRLISKEYFEKVKKIFDVRDIESLKKLIVKYLQERDGNKGKHFNFSEHHILPIEDVIALESIGTLY